MDSTLSRAIQAIRAKPEDREAWAEYCRAAYRAGHVSRKFWGSEPGLTYPIDPHSGCDHPFPCLGCSSSTPVGDEKCYVGGFGLTTECMYDKHGKCSGIRERYPRTLDAACKCPCHYDIDPRLMV